MKKKLQLFQTLIYETFTKKTLIIMKMTIFFFMILTFNVFGTYAYSYGHLNMEVNGSSMNIIPGNPEEGKTSDEFQQKRIAGTVTDENGLPMAGVNIQIEGTTIGAVTDINGKYSIDIPNENAALIFSFIGYNSEKISTTGKTAIDVKLTSTISALDEVVVIGYGTMRKSDLTGSVVRVNMEGKEMAANTSI